MTLPAAYSGTSQPPTTPTNPKPSRTSSAPCSNSSAGPTTSPNKPPAAARHIPDLLLFEDAEAKTRAATGSETSPYLEALAVAELKRFGRPLDTRGSGKGAQASSPHAQILRYLREAEAVTDGDLRWGILTNGAVWRLYDQKTRPRATAFYEADLQALLDVR